MKKTLYLIAIAFAGLIICPAFVSAQGGVGINVAGSPPDNSALLDVNGNNKGVLMPRLTTAQRDAIASPATGLTIFNSDCNVYNFNSGTPSSPNWVTINSSNALVAGVSISASPVGAICAGTNVTFTATPASGINNPGYQWQVNGSNVGTNSSTYSDSALNNGDVISCILSSGAACVTGSPATSNSITMTVNPIPSTPGSISGSSGACPSSSGNSYSISPVAGATSYNWTVPGDATIASGSGNTAITVTFGTDSGFITVSAFNSCGTSASSSLAISMLPPTPGTPGTISGSTLVGSGTSGNVYSISAVNNATTYTWSVPSDATITSGQGSTSVTVTFGSTSGNVAVTAGNSCGTSSPNTLAVDVCIGLSHNIQTYTYTGSQQTFTAPACITSVRYLVVAGGGGGSEGGGGGGGFLTGTLTVVPGNTYPVFVGAGGAGGEYTNNGVNGGNSTFASITAIGGGAGSAQNTNGQAGGSGGGGGAEGGGSTGGAGTAGQGYAGGNGLPNPNPSYAGGGGGGAGGAGGTATGNPYTNGAGGPGMSSDISGSTVYYAGGGGGGSCCGSCCDSDGPGGIGGGGNGSGSGGGSNGTPNTGGGGGGEYTNSGIGGSGGSGIVILSW